MRVRLFRPQDDKLWYQGTFDVEPTDLLAVGVALVALGKASPGDIAYMEDYYLRLDSIEPVRWTCLNPERPELQGLYRQAVLAEDAPCF